MDALAELGVYAVALVCLALATIITLLVLAMFQWLVNLLNKIPAVNIGDAWIGTVRSAVTHALGVAFGEVNHIVGGSFHQLAVAFNDFWRGVKADALLIAHTATLLAKLVYAHAGLRALVHALEKGGKGAAGRIRTLEREYHGIERELKKLERDISKGIGADVLPRIKTLEREVANVEGKVIPSIESAEEALANDITDLGEYVRANFLSVATDAVTAAVAVALAGLGLGGLRCRSFGNLLNKWGCGLGTLLDGLLGLVLSALALEEVCRFLPILETAFGEVVGPITHLLTEVPLGGCEQPPKSWAQLNVAAGPLPPQQTLGALPA